MQQDGRPVRHESQSFGDAFGAVSDSAARRWWAWLIIAAFIAAVVVRVVTGSQVAGAAGSTISVAWFLGLIAVAARRYRRQRL